MANMADCAFAVAKADLNKMDGAIRKAKEGEMPRTVYKRTYKNEKTGDTCTLYEEYEGSRWSCSRIKLVKDGQTIKDYKGEACKDCKIGDDLWNEGYRMDKSYTLENTSIDNGWVIDWQKLDAYSYDMDPFVTEFDDHITVNFGGRWDFPSSLEDTLWRMGVRWQGAGCDSAMDWEFDDGGNEDFGLRIVKEPQEIMGETYYNWFAQDTTNERNEK